MKWFFSRVKKEQVYSTPALLKGVIEKCLRLQSKVAATLQKKSEKLSTGGKKWCLLLFLVIFGGISVFEIVAAFYPTKGDGFNVSHIRVDKSLAPKRTKANALQDTLRDRKDIYLDDSVTPIRLRRIR